MEITLPAGHFYGKSHTVSHVAGLRLHETSYAAGLRLPRHRHQSPCFSLMLQGALTEKYSARILESEPRSICFNAADEEHSNVIHDKGARFFIIELGDEWTRRAPTFRSTVFQAGELNWLGFRLYREFQQPDETSPIAIEGLTLEMIAAMARCHGPTKKEAPSWLREARELINAHYLESLTVSSIAKTVGVHPVHLARTFRATFHSSIGEYIRGLRIQFACEEISSTNLPLVQIAARAGFYDQGHLSRLFKRFTGMTPAQYRSLSQAGKRRSRSFDSSNR